MTNEEIAREYATKWVNDDPNYNYIEELILAAINRAQSEDKARLDWLSGLTTFSYDELRDYMVDSPTYDTVITRQLFTIPSQHVKAPTLREAIDAARKK